MRTGKDCFVSPIYALTSESVRLASAVQKLLRTESAQLLQLPSYFQGVQVTTDSRLLHEGSRIQPRFPECKPFLFALPPAHGCNSRIGSAHERRRAQAFRTRTERGISSAAGAPG